MKQKLILGLALFLLMALIPALAIPSGTHAETPPAESDGASGGGASSAGAESDGQAAENSSGTAQASGRSFRILDEASGSILTVPDEEFLLGAVVTEMPLTYHDEALKAQAVAAYTVYDKKRSDQRQNPTASLKGADFTCNTSEWLIYVTKEDMQERWGSGFEQNYDHLRQVCSDVGLQKLVYQGEPVLATYYAISSGRTEASEDVWGGKRDYLISVDSPGDSQAPGYQTSVAASEDQVRAAVLTKWPDCTLGADPAAWFGEPSRTSSGMVRSIPIGSVTATGDDIRALFSLRSSNFTVTYSNTDGFTFTVLGYGHGVGMSQYGADYMARNGSDYKAILQWYYPGTEIQNAS